MTRQDGRSLKQFKQDIKNSTIDQELILYAWLKTTGQTELKVWDNGSDNSGAYIANSRDVSLDPDYEVEKHGLIEVQYAKPMCPEFFHLKEKKLERCIQGRAKILMVNGWKEDIPQYILITVPQAKVIAARCKIVPWAGGGFKNAHKVPITLFNNWKDLLK
jgi:hypothetical protein